MTPILCLDPFFDSFDPERVIMIICNDSVDDLFFHTMLLILHLRPHDFQCIKALVLEVKSEPNCREVSPTHFLENDVPVVQDLPKLCVMIILLVSLTRYALSDSHPLCSLSGLPSAHLRNHHLYHLHAYPSFFLLF